MKCFGKFFDLKLENFEIKFESLFLTLSSTFWLSILNDNFLFISLRAMLCQQNEIKYSVTTIWEIVLDWANLKKNTNYYYWNQINKILIKKKESLIILSKNQKEKRICWSIICSNKLCHTCILNICKSFLIWTRHLKPTWIFY